LLLQILEKLTDVEHLPKIKLVFCFGVTTPRVPLIPSHLLKQVAFWLLWENILAENSYFSFSFSLVRRER
jgi:hypothetical protein